MRRIIPAASTRLSAAFRSPVSGLEGGARGNEEHSAGRGGGFVRINLRKLQVTLSGGFTGNHLEDDPSDHLSLGLYRTF